MVYWFSNRKCNIKIKEIEKKRSYSYIYIFFYLFLVIPLPEGCKKCRQLMKTVKVERKHQLKGRVKRTWKNNKWLCYKRGQQIMALRSNSACLLLFCVAWELGMVFIFLIFFFFLMKRRRSSHCGATGSVASLECWDTGSIPGPAQ